MENILNEIKAERQRQNQKWGEQNHSVIEWQAILMEEVGEAAKEAVDWHFKNPYLWHGGMIPVLENDAVQNFRLKSYRKELIQIAAFK